MFRFATQKHKYPNLFASLDCSKVRLQLLNQKYRSKNHSKSCDVSWLYKHSILRNCHKPPGKNNLGTPARLYRCIVCCVCRRECKWSTRRKTKPAYKHKCKLGFLFLYIRLNLCKCGFAALLPGKLRATNLNTPSLRCIGKFYLLRAAARNWHIPGFEPYKTWFCGRCCMRSKRCKSNKPQV